MGATEEQMQLLDDAGVMHVSYILVLFSAAFIVFLCKFPSFPLHHIYHLSNRTSRKHPSPHLRRPRMA